MLSRLEKLEWIHTAIQRADKLNHYPDDILHDKLYRLLFFPEETTLGTLVRASKQLLTSDTITLAHLCQEKIRDIQHFIILVEQGVRRDDREVFILAHLDKINACSPALTRINIKCISHLFFRNNFTAFCMFSYQQLLGETYQASNSATLFHQINTQRPSKNFNNIPKYKR